MNKKRLCIIENPAGVVDTMCELLIDTSVAFRMRNIVEAPGKYVFAVWVYADTEAQLHILIGSYDKKVKITRGWNRLQYTIDTNTKGSLFIMLEPGTYRLYRLQINAGDKLCDYESESVVKPLVFGVCEEDAEQTVYNYSDNSIGFTISMQFDALVLKPKIYIVETGEYIEIAGTYRPGEKLEIDTRQGYKSIKAIYHDSTRNIINAISPSSSWLRLNKGINTIGHTAEAGTNHIKTRITYAQEYEGV